MFYIVHCCYINAITAAKILPSVETRGHGQHACPTLAVEDGDACWTDEPDTPKDVVVAAPVVEGATDAVLVTATSPPTASLITPLPMVRAGPPTESV